MCSFDQAGHGGMSYTRRVLTIYEQIQESINFAEENLAGEVTSEAAAATAGMSVRSFHRYFPALTGYGFGSYVRKRRLSEAADELVSSERSILAVALDWGYESHEAFTRAFKREFGVAPGSFRDGNTSVRRIRRIDLVGEVVMGVLTRKLDDMTVVCFDGFGPNPEDAAFQAMAAWSEEHHDLAGGRRVFGYNIDREGDLAFESENEGYRVCVTVPDDVEVGMPTSVIEAGTFLVTGVEGSFEEDPSGAWVGEGWTRFTEMAKRQGVAFHPSRRWFEEVLEPTQVGRTRFDLYVEIE